MPTIEPYTSPRDPGPAGIPFPGSRMRERTRSALRRRLRAAAAAATLGLLSQAQAAVVTFNTPIVVPNTFDGIYINLLTGATGSTGASTTGWDFNPYNSGTTLSFFWSASPSQASGVAASTTGPYLDLAPGTTVGPSSTFAQVTAGSATAAFQSVGTHTMGFRFFNEATTAINYGYATLEVGGTSGFPLTITRWSFENTGAPITFADPFESGFSDGFEDPS